MRWNSSCRALSSSGSAETADKLGKQVLKFHPTDKNFNFCWSAPGESEGWAVVSPAEQSPEKGQFYTARFS